MRPTISPAAFSFHFEAEKNRFGIFSDLNFVRLSTESDFTLQGPLAMTVNGGRRYRQHVLRGWGFVSVERQHERRRHRRAAHIHVVKPSRIQHTECLGDTDRRQPERR